MNTPETSAACTKPSVEYRMTVSAPPRFPAPGSPPKPLPLRTVLSADATESIRRAYARACADRCDVSRSPAQVRATLGRLLAQALRATRARAEHVRSTWNPDGTVTIEPIPT